MSATGGCACGGVRYRVEGPLRPVVACHCETCRRISGHYAAATAVAAADLKLERDETLAWWQATPEAQRGFCHRCGAMLLWRRPGGQRISIFAGTLDRPTGLTLAGHIFCAEKGDYYDIGDGLPQADQRSERLTDPPGAAP